MAGYPSVPVRAWLKTRPAVDFTLAAYSALDAVTALLQLSRAEFFQIAGVFAALSRVYVGFIGANSTPSPMPIPRPTKKLFMVSSCLVLLPKRLVRDGLRRCRVSMRDALQTSADLTIDAPAGPKFAARRRAPACGLISLHNAGAGRGRVGRNR